MTTDAALADDGVDLAVPAERLTYTDLLFLFDAKVAMQFVAKQVGQTKVAVCRRLHRAQRRKLRAPDTIAHERVSLWAREIGSRYADEVRLRGDAQYAKADRIEAAMAELLPF